MAGALFQGRCLGSNAEAVDAFYLSGSASVHAGSPAYMAWFEKVSGVWTMYRTAIADNGAITQMQPVAAPVPVFPSCDPTESFTDGMTVGWGIATAMVLSWGFLMIRRQAR